MGILATIEKRSGMHPRDPVLAGWLAARQRWLGRPEEGDPARVLGNLVFYLFVPALLFRTTARLDLAHMPWATLVEWHGGLRWLWAPLEAEGHLQSVVEQQGGSATLFVAARAYSTCARGQFSL